VAEKSFHRERKQYMHLINAFEKFLSLQNCKMYVFKKNNKSSVQ